MKGYEFKQSTEDYSVDLMIFGDIASKSYCNKESDVGSYDFAKELSEYKGKHLNVHINSYGGEVKEGLAIYNLLKDHGNVTTICDGFACSAASIIFCAGQDRVMHTTSLLMIHNAWSICMGNANEMRKAAEDLDKITEPSIQAYLAVSNLDRDSIKSLMDDETWITANEALDWNFATEVKEVEAKQSLQDQYLANQIRTNKELARRVKELENSTVTQKQDAWCEYFK